MDRLDFRLFQTVSVLVTSLSALDFTWNVCKPKINQTQVSISGLFIFDSNRVRLAVIVLLCTI